ncbi:MAG: ABC transporter permease [Cyanobacteria bacterium]|jgi:ABC-type polysaccharide/polyol phosphate export permease|nr:ABC transporter permease [Cyanobacteria bacterium GSL.Bin1]
MNNSLLTYKRWSKLQRYWELLCVLVERNLKGRYRGSWLGIYWSLLNPLIMAGIYTAVLGRAFSSYYDDSIFNYILAAFTGLSIFHFFAAATNQSLSSLVSSGSLINKIKLPLSIFPSSIIAANVFQFIAANLPPLAIMAFLTSGNFINVLSLIFPLIALILFSSGIGYALSALFVFFRDIPHLYSVTIYALRIATPIFYPAEIVPEKVRSFLLLNPLSQIIESFRQITLSGKLPDLSLIGMTLINSLVVCLLGWLFFHRYRNHFIDLL